jgi:hypothetical protein
MMAASSVGTAAAVIGTGLGLWIAVGYLTGRGGVEHAPYRVLSRHSGFEVRRYAPAVAATCFVEGDEGVRAAGRAGFRSIAGYIFGGNTVGGGKGQSIAMTAPVVTAPREGGHEISFIMPSKYKTAGEMPLPLSGRVVLTELPEHDEAALGWHGGYPGDAAIYKLAVQLVEGARRVGLEPAAPPPGEGMEVDGRRVILRVYGYDPPWTLPFMKWNEVAITLQ